MGKKKTQKTKEISVAIAEASTSKSDHEAAESAPRRKRGRPRKVADEAQNEEKDASEKLPPPEVAEIPPEKKARASAGDEQPPPAVEEAVKQEPKSGDASRSRGRRKNKPRKSS